MQFVLALLIFAAVAAAQQPRSSPGGGPAQLLLDSTIAALPASPAVNTVRVVTDATGVSCTVGGGSTVVLCRWNGSSWAPLGDGNTAGTPSFADVTAGTNLAALAVGAGGSLDLSAANFFKPKAYTGAPTATDCDATGEPGRLGMNTDSSAGERKLHYCIHDGTTIQWFSVQQSLGLNSRNGSGTEALGFTGGHEDVLADNHLVIWRQSATRFINKALSGTTNEVSVSGLTISLPATIDLGGKTSFEIPNGATPTVDAFGEIAGDNDLWAASRGAPVFFDGTAAVALIGVLVSDAPSNGECPKWNTGGTITWESCTGGSGYATVQDEATPLTQRATLNFTGAGVTCADNAGSTRTDCTIPGASTSMTVNSQTGTTYTYLDGDNTKLVTHSNASAIAGTLPNAAGAGFDAGWWMEVQNRGAGTLTITPTTSTIDGAASLVLRTDQGVRIVSDGTNYFTERGMWWRTQGGAGVTCTDSGNITTCAVDTATIQSLPNDQAGTPRFCNSSTGSDTYTCGVTPALTAYATGMSGMLKVATANTGAGTLDIDGLGPKNLKKISGGAKVDVATGDILAAGLYKWTYDGTDIIILNPSTLSTLPITMTFSAGTCQNATASHAFNTEATAPTATCVTGTNTIQGVLQYPDSDGDYDIQANFPLPADWTGAIDLLVKWRAVATTGDVVWQVQTVCVADGETSDPAFNSAQTITDTAKGTTLQDNEASLTSVTTTGCAAGERLFFRFRRNRTHASDTIANTLDLISLRWTLRRAL